MRVKSFNSQKNMGHLLLKQVKGKQKNMYRAFNYSLGRLNIMVVLYASLSYQTYMIESYVTIVNRF